MTPESVRAEASAASRVVLKNAMEHALRMVAVYEHRNAELIKEHGDGVRPGWVSADLATNGETIKRWQRLHDNLILENT